ncbi:hypothetical protein [Caldinitratiruptor microaerophilus]|uniref:Uncharacterized protein n=1 Tax=Caldinitratiruptor microaerophilus TaxID=671077 RepID=A0AA35CMJ1_9FIRM|nr:hypothetical protein [Caldinitratiruptor microaerophilus]BDG61937.1 hypothetical protein caldi_30270 [Caldinitratiruptor microaerophilus]
MESLNAQVARLDQRVEDLERWQNQQNGALYRLEERVITVERRINQLGWGIAATLGGVILDLLLRVKGVK